MLDATVVKLPHHFNFVHLGVFLSKAAVLWPIYTNPLFLLLTYYGRIAVTGNCFECLTTTHCNRSLPSPQEHILYCACEERRQAHNRAPVQPGMVPGGKTPSS